MRFDTVIFDLDGTLLDTLRDLTDSVNEMLRANGYPERGMEEIRSFLGSGAKKLIWSALPEGAGEEEVDRRLEEYRPIYKRNMNKHTRPYDGIMEMLDALRGSGVKMGVVSNKPDGPCKELVARIFGAHISVAIGDRPDVERKPARASVDEALRMLGAELSGAVYVGDSEVDIMTARNAEMPCVGVTWGFRDREVFEEAGVEYIIDSPDELFGILDIK